MERVGAYTDRVTAQGEWRPGDPATNTRATPLLAAYFNMLQRELLAILSAAGIEPDAENEAQLLEALNTLFLTQLPGTAITEGNNANSQWVRLTRNGPVLNANRTSQGVAFTVEHNGDTVASIDTSGLFRGHVHAGDVDRGTLDEDRIPSSIARTSQIPSGFVLPGNNDISSFVRLSRSAPVLYVNRTNSGLALIIESAGEAVATINTEGLFRGSLHGADVDRGVIAEPYISTAIARLSQVPNFATTAQSREFSDNTVIISPVTLQNAFTGPRNGLQSRGYQMLPGGLIIQWGTQDVDSFETFPIAFPNACRSVVLTDYGELNTGDLSVFSTSNSGFRIRAENPSAGIAYWIAIGH